jgi:hypothetical protein
MTDMEAEVRPTFPFGCSMLTGRDRRLAKTVFRKDNEELA